MKNFILFALISLVLSSALAKSFSDRKLGGTIYVDKKLASQIEGKGVLYVFAKKQGQKAGPPVAVLKIDRPKFPQAFVIGPKNVMIPGTVYQGPFTLTAKYSASGNPLDNKNIIMGIIGEKEGIELGGRNLKILLR